MDDACNTLSLSLETESINDFTQSKNHFDWKSGLWQCVELHELCIEGAMVTTDGSPLVTVPPPGGMVRMGVACKKYISNTSVEQLLFVLKLYAYMGKVGEDISKVGSGGKDRTKGQSILKGNKEMDKSGSLGGFVEMVPSDTAVSLFVDSVYLKFLESVPAYMEIQGPPLVQFLGNGLHIEVSHRTLGGAMVISSVLRWQSIQVDCVETELKNSVTDPESKNGDFRHHQNGTGLALLRGTECSDFTREVPQMRAVLWIDGHRDSLSNGHSDQHGPAGHLPFLDVSVVHVLPYRAQDAECNSLNVTVKVSGVRLGGGMNYNEALLHRFGILGPDGGPGEGLKNGLNNLSRGPLAKLLKSSPQVKGARTEANAFEKLDNDPSLELTSPDDIEIDIKLQDWLFALEGTESVTEGPMSDLLLSVSVPREQKCWHMALRSICVSAKSREKSSCNQLSEKEISGKKHPVETVSVSVEGLQVLKPQNVNFNTQLHTSTNCVEGFLSSPIAHDFSSKRNGLMQNPTLGSKSRITSNSGVDVKVQMVISDNDADGGTSEWVVQSVRGTIKEPVEIEATKEELDYLVLLSKSEIESLSRITAGILQILQLQGSVGQAAIDQLSNFGAGSLDKIITSHRFKRQSSIGRISCMLADLNVESSEEGPEFTITRLEKAVSESQIICSALSRSLAAQPAESKDYALSTPRMSAETGIKELAEHLKMMQTLLLELRNKVV